MIVDVSARKDGIPYTFKGVQVNSVADLTQRYGAAGIEILGYTVINQTAGPAPVNVPGSGGAPVLSPGVVMPGPNGHVQPPATNSSKGVLIVAGLLLLWLFWS